VSRAGIEPVRLNDRTQVTDSTTRQKRQNRYFRRFEVHSGYTAYEFISSENKVERPLGPRSTMEKRGKTGEQLSRVLKQASCLMPRNAGRSMDFMSAPDAPRGSSRRLGEAQVIQLSVRTAAMVRLESRGAGRTSRHIGPTVGHTGSRRSSRHYASSDKIIGGYLFPERPSRQHSLPIYRLGVGR